MTVQSISIMLSPHGQCAQLCKRADCTIFLHGTYEEMRQFLRDAQVQVDEAEKRSRPLPELTDQETAQDLAATAKESIEAAQ